MRPARRRLATALLLGIAVSAGVTALSRVGLFGGWETRAVDSFLFLRDREPAPEIALVLIDDDAFAALGERQPLSRRYLADLAGFLLESGARVVTFDVVLTRSTTEAEDAALLDVVRRAGGAGRGRVLFASTLRARTGGRYELAPPFAPALAAHLGYANAPLGPDGVVRRMAPALPAVTGGYLPSLALATVIALDPDGGIGARAALAAGRGAVPLAPREAGARLARREDVRVEDLGSAPWRVDFAGPPGDLVSFPSGALLAAARAGQAIAADNPFRDRIVLVGATFAEGREFYPTPVGLMAGVEIQAHMVRTLLARRVTQPPHWLLNLGLLVSVCLAVAVLSLWLRPLAVAGMSAVLVLVLVALSYEAYTRGGYWLDFVAPVVAMLGYAQVSGWAARRRLRAAFGQYVSPEVMDRVLREGTALGGEVRTVTVLMSDVRGFTTLSERLPPARISAIMNEYFTAMVEVIAAQRGLVNDFIGDGILAIYGAPVDDPEHAWHAVATALGMQRALADLNTRWAARGDVTLAMGVAVHTGEAFAGNMGSPRKKKYSVLGDTVNTVARMEGLNRDLGTEILVSAATLACVRDRVVVRDRGAVKVKGREQPIELFELLSAGPFGLAR